ncbi:FadR/GntR family transcriptional regulator [Plantibacter sp. CFBP 13570]|uniref:FadR/GntR family transcriptional regulator n=1 Tax=Plantibacter sp. CFBP 13570 TaxID=2775272 RepID=UPI001930D043|nr:FadR/GntR family transcriptional regulator [Plantibacter sp. CFBP 13570]MBD8534586.1 FadR family transcriptional regulator [Plantibacter sp. CFBP 13570]
MSEPATRFAKHAIFADAAAKVPATRLGVAVVHDLVTAIVTGEVAEGSMLPIEAELTAHFGVSRTVIRESIKRVEEKGLVSVVQGSGTTVRSQESWNVLDPVVLEVMLEHDDSLGVLDQLAVVRSSLEGAMAAATAVRRSATELEAMEHAIQLMSDSMDDEQGFGDADMMFHMAVMAASNIPLAESINRTLYTRARDTARFTLNGTREAFEASRDEHSIVLEAIRAGDADQAERAMRHHILESWGRRRPPTSRRP